MDRITKIFKENTVTHSSDEEFIYFEVSDGVESSMSVSLHAGTHKLNLNAVNYMDGHTMSEKEAKENFGVDLSELYCYLMEEKSNKSKNVFPAVLRSFGL